ncbi:hypothetical protein CYMTET_28711, partial [Cymbomonas tetramitiformis]
AKAELIQYGREAKAKLFRQLEAASSTLVQQIESDRGEEFQILKLALTQEQANTSKLLLFARAVGIRRTALINIQRWWRSHLWKHHNQGVPHHPALEEVPHLVERHRAVCAKLGEDFGLPGGLDQAELHGDRGDEAACRLYADVVKLEGLETTFQLLEAYDNVQHARRALNKGVEKPLRTFHSSFQREDGSIDHSFLPHVSSHAALMSHLQGEADVLGHHMKKNRSIRAELLKQCESATKRLKIPEPELYMQDLVEDAGTAITDDAIRYLQSIEAHMKGWIEANTLEKACHKLNMELVEGLRSIPMKTGQAARAQLKAQWDRKGQPSLAYEQAELEFVGE